MMQVGDIIGFQEDHEGTITLSYIGAINGESVALEFTDFPLDDPNRDFAEDEKARLIANPPPPPPAALILEDRKATALTLITERVARTRKVYITDLVGQEMVYLDKEAEARRYVMASPVPATLADYPWLEREVGVTGQTPYEVAQVFLNMAAIWRSVGPDIEGLRLEAKANIINAATLAEIDMAIGALDAGLGAYE